MFLIMLMGILASAAATTWSFTSQRDKELDLVFAGREYRAAIKRYVAAHARERQPFPTDLKQLLGAQDRLVPVRYLRRLYPDPMTGRPAWGLVRTPEGGITGVFSLSSRQPIRVMALRADDGIDFADAKTYQDWIFGVDAATASTDRALPPGWDPARDGAPPLRWDSAHPQPVPGTDQARD